MIGRCGRCVQPICRHFIQFVRKSWTQSLIKIINISCHSATTFSRVIFFCCFLCLFLPLCLCLAMCPPVCLSLCFSVCLCLPLCLPVFFVSLTVVSMYRVWGWNGYYILWVIVTLICVQAFLFADHCSLSTFCCVASSPGYCGFIAD